MTESGLDADVRDRGSYAKTVPKTFGKNSEYVNKIYQLPMI